MNVYELSYVFLITFTFFESYIMVVSKTYNLTYLFGLLQVIKFALILIPAWSIFENRKINKNFIVIFLLFCLLMLFALLNGLKNDIVYKPNIAISIKNIYIWYFYLLISMLFMFRVNKNTLRLLIGFILIYSVISAIYSLWVIFRYNGDPSIFYFYRLYSEMNMFTEYNFIRNGVPRAFGFAGSSITYSQLLLIPLSFSYCYFEEKKSILRLFVLFTIFVCMIITQQRNPIMAFIVSIVAFTLFNKTGKIKYLVIVDILFVLISFGALFLLVFLGYIPPWSSTGGRVAQMAMTMSKIIENPIGFGIGSTGLGNNMYKFHADLSLFTIVMDLGVIGAILFYGMIFMVIKRVSTLIVNNSVINLNNKYFKSAILVLNSIILMTEYGNIFDNSILAISVYCSAIFAYCISYRSSTCPATVLS